MAYSMALNTVYNHYLTTYTPKTSQYDTHKKSELRGIYNSIVKLNKDSPLYLLDSSRESREFAVNLKENARALRNTIASLGGLGEKEMLGKRSAYSSNEGIASAVYIGGEHADGSIPSYEIEVTSLASNQVNLGTFLPSEGKIELEPDAYSFDIAINDLSYEFHYNIHEGETNRILQDRLSRLVTNADIGLVADVLEDGNGNSSLRLTSTGTGLKNGRESIFFASDDKTSKRAGTVDYLGLDFISRTPSNAEFLLNGEPRSASSNHFTIEKMYQVALNGISSTEGETATIGLKTDLDSLAENVGNLVNGYNYFMSTASRYLDLHPRSGRLVKEMDHISRHYQPELESLGFTFEENGHLALDDDTFKYSFVNGSKQSPLATMKEFTNSILRKTNQISLNPMEYVDKTLVAYKNPKGNNFATPYMTSNYTGMLFNGYC